AIPAPARRGTGGETMTVERHQGGTSLIDVLDRVLDKGIVIDAWVRISLVGIDLITVEARIVVASIDTYLKYAEAIGITSPAGRPAGGAPGLGPAGARGARADARLQPRLRGAGRPGAPLPGGRGRRQCARGAERARRGSPRRGRVHAPGLAWREGGTGRRCSP